MNNIFLERQEKIFKQLSAAGIFAAVLKDFEGIRNSSIRYLTGHPQDALLFIFAKGATILVPWDINLAAHISQPAYPVPAIGGMLRKPASGQQRCEAGSNKCSAAEQNRYCTEIIPYTEFNRNFSNAVTSIFSGKVSPIISQYLGNSFKSEKIEFSNSSSWLEIESLKKLLPDKEIICRDNGIDSMLNHSRMIKDEKEITIYREAAKITNKIIDKLEKHIKKLLNNSLKSVSEVEVALLIEKLARESGAEGLGFETLVAGPERSWAIHPYPAFSSSPITKTGTTIIDFGVKYQGYTTDVTITFAGKNLADKHNEMINLVSQAADRAEKLLKPEETVLSVSENIKEFFSQYGYIMPHSLGHGIGLDVHENPILKSSNENAVSIKEGMILAVEPGLYDPLYGGVRLENDYLITEDGYEKLTSSRIIFLDS